MLQTEWYWGSSALVCPCPLLRRFFVLSRGWGAREHSGSLSGGWEGACRFQAQVSARPVQEALPPLTRPALGQRRGALGVTAVN